MRWATEIYRAMEIPRIKGEIERKNDSVLLLAQQTSYDAISRVILPFTED
jgi:hypothetical protein